MVEEPIVDYPVIKDLVIKSMEKAALTPSLLVVDEVPTLVVGDIHGDLESLVKALELAERSRAKYVVFLGDYIDRGPKQLEVLYILLSNYSSRNNLILLRGNHETPSVNSHYGFLDVLRNEYPLLWYELYKLVNKFFALLPYAVICKGYLLVHGGLARGLESIEDLMNLKKPLLDPEPGTKEFEVLWNDPAEFIEGFIPGVRGEGTFVFGPDVTMRFLRRNKLRGIIRSHEPPGVNGYSYTHNNSILTIFTCRYYGLRPTVAIIKDHEISLEFLD